MKQNYRKFNLILLLIILFSIVITSCESIAKPEKQSITNKLCYQSYCPIGAPENNFIVDHKIYILSSNRKTKFADWVAYRLDKTNLNGPSRKRIWRKDPKIPAAYTLSPQDYKGAHAACGVDRGHQAPLASFSNNSNWENTNYLSNITPQKSVLNQGPWVRLESAVRRLVEKNKSVYVVTGPIYNSKEKICSLPAQPSLKIPNAYFKVIFQLDNNITHYAAFIMPQKTTRRTNMCKYAVNLQAIRDKTGLHFLKSSSTNKDESLLKKLGC